MRGTDDDVKPAAGRWTQRRDTPRALRAEATRASLVAAAREMFVDRGYAAVGIRELCDRIGVSRGTLTRHFPKKTDLFEAVFEAVEEDLNADITRLLGVEPTADPWSLFRRSIQLYLDAVAARPDVQRITLVDGPSVLGWARWRAIEERFSLGAFTLAIEAAIDSRSIRAGPAEPLAHLIFGSVIEAALLLANAENPATDRADVGRALDDMLAGLTPA